MASELNATIGYSNPSKLTFGTACNIIVEKILVKIRIRYAQRGITLALIKVLVVRLFWVLWWNPVCLTYRNITHGKQQSITTHFSECNAQTHDDMTF